MIAGNLSRACCLVIEHLQLLLGDCLEALPTLQDNSVDSIVTDPPYGLSFMGKGWDYQVPSVEIWQQCFRVLKPGGHLLAFAGTRTQHRMCVNIEDAGFEIRDMIAWVYGSGFPKSMDVSKAIDKAAGAEREVIGRRTYGDGHVQNSAKLAPPIGTFQRTQDDRLETAPATPEAQQWEGWGTALKPALEPITVARKPFKGTVAANVLEHGTGAINVDGCRVAGTWERNSTTRCDIRGGKTVGGGSGQLDCEPQAAHPGGRWPANLIHDGSDDVVGLFPQSTSTGGSGPASKNWTGDGRTVGAWCKGATGGFGDSGSAARFFQQCKGDYDGVWQDLNLPPELVSTADSHLSQQRQAVVSALVLAVSSALPEGQHCSGLSMEPFTNATGSELKTLEESVTQAILNIAPRFWHESGLARLSLTSSPVSVVVQKEPTGITTITASHWKSDGSAAPVTYSITPLSLAAGERDSVARFKYCAKASKADRGDGNTHPTVKPTDLMRYLCRLVTPPGGTVLDPFMGSGSTGKAAVLEGFRFIGVEREADYFKIAQQRIQPPPDAQLILGVDL